MESLRGLAGSTDGIAVIDSDDLDKGMKRISDDLTSVLLVRVLLDEWKTRRQVPQHRGAREAAPASTCARAKGTAPRRRLKSPRRRLPPLRRPARARLGCRRQCRRWRGSDGLAPESERGCAQVCRRSVPVRSVGGGRAFGRTGQRIATRRGHGQYHGRRGRQVRECAGDSAARRALVRGAGDAAAGFGSGPQLDVRARLTGPDSSIDGLSGNTSVNLSSANPQPMLFRRGPVTGNKLVPAASFLSAGPNVRASSSRRPPTQSPVPGACSIAAASRSPFP